jgi:hypothetical protein
VFNINVSSLELLCSSSVFYYPVLLLLLVVMLYPASTDFNVCFVPVCFFLEMCPKSGLGLSAAGDHQDWIWDTSLRKNKLEQNRQQNLYSLDTA